MKLPAAVRKRMVYVALVAAACTLIALYAAADPSSSGWLLKCPFRLLTGLQCPGCGSQRMLHALLHGNIAQAWHYNALLLSLIPFLPLLILLELKRGKMPTLYMKVYGWKSCAAACAIIILWTIGRNIYAL